MHFRVFLNFLSDSSFTPHIGSTDHTLQGPPKTPFEAVEVISMHSPRRSGGSSCIEMNKVSLACFLSKFSLLRSKENEMSRACQDFFLITFALKIHNLISKLFVYLD